MEDKKKKCSKIEHKDIDAISYCQECKIYICNKCSNFHQELFNNHQINILDNNQEIFIDICKEKNHPLKLEFYCKNHNKLCCAACLTKVETKGYGQHKDCDICIIEEIKEEKKNKLKNNIKCLEDLSNNLNNSIKELKELFEKIDERKEELKTKIQNIFTKLRTALNEREDELLLEVDNKYKDLYGNDNIIKESEKLPNKIKILLEKGKISDNEWKDNNKLSSIINNCINIEDNIKNINIINDNIKKCKLNNEKNIDFNIEEDHLENFIKNIKIFGQINYPNKIIKLNSLILKDQDEINKFSNLLSSQIKIKNMKLIFTSNKDELNFVNLQKKINNKSNLIFLFLTGNTRIFGLFVKVQIEVKHDVYIKDDNAFVFSLNNNKIYKILIPEYALRFYEGNPIIIGNTGNSNGFWTCFGKFNCENLLNDPKIFDFQKSNELTEGKNDPIIFEIFQVII